MKVKVYAKLKLTLNVTGRRNGFHDIDSLAVSVDIYDEIQASPRSDRAVTVRGMPSVNNADNSAYKAASAFVRAFGSCGADITVNKGIPFAAGMGGSSADVAAVVYCMCKLYGVDISSRKVYDLCAALGSDVNYMLRGGLGRLRGKGDDVEFYRLARPLYFALTTFGVGISSKEAYSAFDLLPVRQPPADNGKLLNMLTNGEANAVKLFNNHLQGASASLSDYAREYLGFIAEHGLSANMTGSGSAYYAAFDDKTQADKTAELLSAKGYDTVVCKTVDNGIEEVI